MGLISLPLVNKIQDSNYWSNAWDSKLLYKKYLFLSLFLNKFFNIIFSDYSLNILISYFISLNLKKGYITNSNLKNNFLKSYLLGKVWILKYQKWFIIVIKIFSLENSLKISFKKKKIKNWVSFNQSLNFNNNFLNYKSKF